MDKNTQPRSGEFFRGVYVLVFLGVLTAVEYFVAIAGAPSFFLWLIAIVKAATVLWYFMHINRLFNQDGGHA